MSCKFNPLNLKSRGLILTHFPFNSVKRRVIDLEAKSSLSRIGGTPRNYDNSEWRVQLFKLLPAGLQYLIFLE